MTATLAIRGVGLVTSVGLSAPTSCAAIRAKLTNPCETRFIDAAGEWIRAHEVPLTEPLRGCAKLAQMAAMSIEECLRAADRDDWHKMPLLLCTAEPERPGRLEDLETLPAQIERLLGVTFAPASAVIAHGRVSVALALRQAHSLIQQARTPGVLIAAADTLLNWETLSAYERADRLLTKRNSNGLMPGEAAGAVWVSEPAGNAELRCAGVGLGLEAAHIDSGEPLRGEGLTTAIKAALLEANRQMHDMSFRIADLSGEQYYFHEAALALTRCLRGRKARFDIWHPAECTGEAGAAAGLSMLAVADAACRNGYAPGDCVLAHMSNDDGRRAAIILQFAGG
jgi:3-oxoacyl-[acyl-carrier-protein] synthase-1